MGNAIHWINVYPVPDRAIVCLNTFTLELLPGVFIEPKKNLCAILSHFLLFGFFVVVAFTSLSFFSFSLSFSVSL